MEGPTEVMATHKSGQVGVIHGVVIVLASDCCVLSRSLTVLVSQHVRFDDTNSGNAVEAFARVHITLGVANLARQD